MRELKFDIPTKLSQSRIECGKLENGKGTQYFEKVSVVFTEKGLVTVYQMDWETNRGKLIYTAFATVVNGYRYSATLNQSNLSDRQLKWLSTNFINQIYKSIS